MIETVRKNLETFTEGKIELAKLSRETQAMIGHPSDSTFKQIMSYKTSQNLTT